MLNNNYDPNHTRPLTAYIPSLTDYIRLLPLVFTSGVVYNYLMSIFKLFKK
jgi:hypothetical protein